MSGVLKLYLWLYLVISWVMWLFYTNIRVTFINTIKPQPSQKSYFDSVVGQYFCQSVSFFPLTSKWTSFLDSTLPVFQRFCFLSSYAACASSLLFFLNGPGRSLLMAFSLGLGICQHLERIKCLSSILHKRIIIASGVEGLYSTLS